ncbi:MAG: cation:proton antiporter [Acidobacteriota bacterium]
MDLHAIAVVAALVFAFALISKRAADGVLTPPMFFTGAGLLLGSAGLSLLHLDVDTMGVQLLAEATLIFVLFVDAAKVDPRRLRREYSLPLRLLALGMPLQIALGTLLAKALFSDLSWWQAGLISSILAPTDAALGQAVVSSPRVPESLRQTLSVESGLNDGIALPIVTIFLATCLTLEAALPASHWIDFTARQIGFGTLVGVAVGALGALLLNAAQKRKWMTHGLSHVATLALAVLSYALAHSLEGNGFIAAFVAGFSFGCSTRQDKEHLFGFAEEEGELLTLVTFLVFGVALLPSALSSAPPLAWLYAAFSLTAVRMLPVALALLGTELDSRSRLFVGWFGPRGLASILFALLVVEASGVKNGELIVSVVLITVLASVFAHGISAQPLAHRIGKG